MKIPLFSKARKEAIDPVCHMSVSTENPNVGKLEYEENSYYFCAPGCRIAFQKDPEGYLSGQKQIDM